VPRISSAARGSSADGSSSNVLEVRASHVIIRGLEFGPTLPDVDAIRIFGGEDITVEACRFSDLGGIAVVANHSNVHGLLVRRNEIVFARSTAMYFGCHDAKGVSRVSSGAELHPADDRTRSPYRVRGAAQAEYDRHHPR
jgi:hypothetical protein